MISEFVRNKEKLQGHLKHFLFNDQYVKCFLNKNFKWV